MANKTIDEKIDDLAIAVKAGFEAVDKRFESVDKKIEGIDKRLIKIEATMVTKDYLDQKQADLKGDLVLLMRKEDTKLKALIQLLEKKNIISQNDAKQIFGMDPFPQLAL